MTRQEILRGIIAHSTSSTVRAAQLLSKPDGGLQANKRDSVMWRLAKATLESSDAGKLPTDLKTALEELVKFGEAGLLRKRDVTVRFRCTEEERSIIEALAACHTSGNISRWLVQRGTTE